MFIEYDFLEEGYEDNLIVMFVMVIRFGFLGFIWSFVFDNDYYWYMLLVIEGNLRFVIVIIKIVVDFGYVVMF